MASFEVFLYNSSFSALTAILTEEANRARIFCSHENLRNLASVPASAKGSSLWNLAPQEPFYAEVLHALIRTSVIVPWLKLRKRCTGTMKLYVFPCSYQEKFSRNTST